MGPIPAGEDRNRTGPEAPIEAAATGTGLLLVGFVFSMALTVAFQLILARTLSTADVGRYFVTTAIAGILLIACTGGLVPGLVRFGAILDPPRAAALARTVVVADIGLAGALGAGLWLLAPVLARGALGDPSMTTLLRVSALGLPLAALADLWAAYARGRQAFRYYFLSEQVSLPLGRLLFLLIAFAAGAGVLAAIVAGVVGYGISAAIGLFAAYRLGVRLVGPLSRSRRGDVAELLAFSSYRWGVDVLQAVLLWADTVILGILRPPSVTGTYSVAARVVIGVSIGLPALNLALAPFFARQLGDRDRGPLGDLYGVAARWGAILTFVPLAVVFAYRREILGFLDPGLVPGSTVITILIFGFLFNAACGPVGNVLNMSALNRLVLVDSLITVGANVALNLILIPAWGMNGAALAWSLSLGLVNVLMVSQVHRRLGVAVLRGPQVRTSVGLLLVFAGQIVASTVLGPGPVAAIGVAGALVVVALTRQPEDHRVLGSVLARVRGPIGRSANDGE